VEGALTRAAAANHRAWFRRRADAIGRFGGIDLIVEGPQGTIGFPRSRARLDEALRWARGRGVRGMSCWSLTDDHALGVKLLARGFEWGWQPWWMALDLALLPDEEPAHPVVVKPGGRLVVPGAGGVIVFPWRRIAGLYDMGVEPSRRRQGIGHALTLAACRVARDAGCTHATLNATPMGMPVYRRVGFRMLGAGQTWWWHGWRPPTPRQTALVEAIGFGDLEALAELRPTRAELERQIRGPGSPLAVTAMARQPAAADWILRRQPELASRPLDQRGAALLHLAVESDDPALVEVALAHGADPTVRDRTFNSTPLGWAEHFGRPALAARLTAESQAGTLGASTPSAASRSAK
jgi:GNAT superfamily N-acetyltransferase